MVIAAGSVYVGIVGTYVATITASTQVVVEVAEIYAHCLTVPELSDFKAEQ